MRFLQALATILAIALGSPSAAGAIEPVRVFIFAGQSNMEGADSKVADVDRFPPFVGYAEPLPEVRFHYVLGRENKTRSEGWVPLHPVREMVGPELSFARTLIETIDAPLAIIKVAAGGTHLGGDWNPDEPSGFEMYPLLIKTVREALATLDQERVDYRLEGFVWHQGENDMFNAEYMANYGTNLARFVARVRDDLEKPDLRFYVGELCVKSIWGMDLRPRMYAISQGQKAVAAADPLVDYVPTAHIAVEIGRPVGLHYHYGTLGQLEHGVNHAEAYLKNVGLWEDDPTPLETWPFEDDAPVRLFVVAGHRNMEGERAFVQEAEGSEATRDLLEPNPKVAFRYSIGGGVKTSEGWEPLRPAGFYDTFGPELAFGNQLLAELEEPIAIAKFTHSGSQILDWTPEGSEAVDRNLYPAFIQFVKEAVADLEERGHAVDLQGIFYHVGENDMSFMPHRSQAAEWLGSIIEQSRIDLERPDLPWFVTQQKPTDHERVNDFDVVAAIQARAEADPHVFHRGPLALSSNEERLVISTEGVFELGEAMVELFLTSEPQP